MRIANKIHHIHLGEYKTESTSHKIIFLVNEFLLSHLFLKLCSILYIFFRKKTKIQIKNIIMSQFSISLSVGCPPYPVWGERVSTCARKGNWFPTAQHSLVANNMNLMVLPSLLNFSSGVVSKVTKRVKHLLVKMDLLPVGSLMEESCVNLTRIKRKFQQAKDTIAGAVRFILFILF